MSASNKFEVKEQADATTDPNLVQLAGYHAYQEYDKNDEIKVNDKKFQVLDTEYDTKNGLDALTVKNIETNELTVVFVGSDQIKQDWLGTNTKLISKKEPEQLKDAKNYFKHVEKTFGNVSHVTGNSLGGALSNVVAIDNPDVKSVTLNPAMLPEGMVNPDKGYSNITNYQSQYDFLTHAQEGMQLGDRIPGNTYKNNQFHNPDLTLHHHDI